MVGIPSYEPPKRKKKSRFLWKAGVLCLGFLIASLVFHKPSPTLFSIKQQHPDFVGRENVFHEIKRSWKSRKNRIAHILLWGEPGIGKTETAIAFANRYSRAFNIVFFVNCASKEMMETNYRALAERLSIPLPHNASFEQITDKVHEHLEQARFCWLLVFDNVSDPLPLPQRGRGLCLITARDSSLISSADAIKIPAFTLGESHQLIRKIFPELCGKGEQRLIAKWEGLPIMLAESLRYLKRTNICDLNSYLSLLEQREEALTALHPKDERYGDPFSRSFALSLSYLEAKNPKAATFLKMAAFLYPDRIPKEWIESWLALSGEGDKVGRKIQANEIASELIQSGYLRYDKKEEVFSIHRLFQRLIRAQDRGEEVFDSTLKLLAAPLRGPEKKLYFELLFQGRIAQSDWAVNAIWFVDRYAEQIADFSQLSPDKQMEWISLQWGIGEHLVSARSLYDKGEAYFLRAKELYQQSLCKRPELEAKILASYARCHSVHYGYPSAIPIREKALELSRQIDSPLLHVHYLLHMTFGYMFLDTDRAMQYLDEAEEIGQQDPRFSCSGELAEILSHRGQTYLYQEDFRKAKEALFRALEINRLAYGKRPNSQKIWILRDLGRVLIEEGECREAINYLNDASSVASEVFNTSYCLANAGIGRHLCRAYSRIGKLKKAIYWGDKSLKILSVLFPDAPHDFTINQHLVSIGIYRKQKNRKKELEHYRQLFSLVPKTEGIRPLILGFLAETLQKYELKEEITPEFTRCKEHVKRLQAAL